MQHRFNLDLSMKILYNHYDLLNETGKTSSTWVQGFLFRERKQGYTDKGKRNEQNAIFVVGMYGTLERQCLEGDNNVKRSSKRFTCYLVIIEGRGVWDPI